MKASYGDGDLDLLSANHDSNNVTIFLQNNVLLNGFEPVPLIITDATNMLGPQGIRTGDIDSDGDLDVMIVNRTTDDASCLPPG